MCASFMALLPKNASTIKVTMKDAINAIVHATYSFPRVVKFFTPNTIESTNNAMTGTAKMMATVAKRVSHTRVGMMKADTKVS